jgi:hypothetical protein
MGLDLKDNLSRFQIITKVPYPNRGDRWIEEKRKINGASIHNSIPDPFVGNMTKNTTTSADNITAYSQCLRSTLSHVRI